MSAVPAARDALMRQGFRPVAPRAEGSVAGPDVGRADHRLPGVDRAAHVVELGAEPVEHLAAEPRADRRLTRLDRGDDRACVDARGVEAVGDQDRDGPIDSGARPSVRAAPIITSPRSSLREIFPKILPRPFRPPLCRPAAARSRPPTGGRAKRRRSKPNHRTMSPIA